MRNRLISILHALTGLKTVFAQERNFQIQIFISIAVFILMFLFPLTAVERVFLVLVMCLVLILELTNTALEYTLDIFHPRVHPTVGMVKDIMAGAVLVGALAAGIVGILIFLPHVQLWFHSGVFM
jgi:diacylglycerol kinase